MTESRGRVLLVEDYECVAHALQLVLAERGLSVARPADFSPAAVLKQAEEFRPGLVLLDFWLGEADSIPMIAPLAEMGFKVLMFTAMDNREVLGACFERGAVGVISKVQDLEGLVAGIEDALAGRGLLPSEVRDELIALGRAGRALESQRHDAFRALTPREDEILRLLIDGKRADDIARRELITIATVRTHLRAVLEKLGVSSQVEAVALAHRSGWPPDLPSAAGRWGPQPPRSAPEGRKEGDRRRRHP